jgi:hypothetical protein
MINRIISVFALMILSTGVFAASVSTTTFSGSGYSDTRTNGGHADVTIYTGFTAARETGPGVYSESGTVYAGSTSDVGTYRERSSSDTNFYGISTNDGLVGRTVQTTETYVTTVGQAEDHTTANEAGFFSEFSAVGDGYNGTIGVEVGFYSDSSFEDSYTTYGSNSYAETYSADSYAL